MTEIKFPAGITVTRCQTESVTYIELTRHGVIRHELSVNVKPFIVGVTGSGRMFAETRCSTIPTRYIAPACGPNCPNVGWKL